MAEFQLADVTLQHPALANTHGTALALDLARALSKLGVATIDVGALDNPVRFQLAHSLGSVVPHMAVMAHAEMNRLEITHVYEALKTSRYPRLGLLVPTAPEAVRGTRRTSYSELLWLLGSYVTFGVRLGMQVDAVIAQPAATDPIFVARLAQAAVAAGASGITLLESARVSADGFSAMVKQIVRAVPGARVSVQCAGHSAMAANLAMLALRHGATEIGTVATEWGEELPCPSLQRLANLGAVVLSPLQLSRVTSSAECLRNDQPHAIAPAANGGH